MSKDILYTPAEIADKLRIAKGTVYEMIKRGDLDAHHIGKHLRISDNQLETYLQKSRGIENLYEAIIVQGEDQTMAQIGPVNIIVNTELKGQVKLSIRPEDIILSKGTFSSSARNVHKGEVSKIIQDQDHAKVLIDIGIPIIALITKRSLDEMELEKGTELYTVFKTMTVKVYK